MSELLINADRFIILNDLNLNLSYNKISLSNTLCGLHHNINPIGSPYKRNLGNDFFSNLPKEVQQVVEAKVNGQTIASKENVALLIIENNILGHFCINQEQLQLVSLEVEGSLTPLYERSSPKEDSREEDLERSF